MKNKIKAGFGCIRLIKKLLKKNNYKNIFLVSGNKSFESFNKKASDYQTFKNVKVIRFCDFQNNPKLEDVKKGIKQIKKEPIDLIIAIGGGSVIDMAKLINFFSNQKNSLEKYIIQKEEPENNCGYPLIAIPTTVGSGSESTHFAVVYINKEKYSVVHKSILPRYVFLDPDLIRNLPEYILAYSGMDTISQGIESFWSVNSTVQSTKLSVKAIKLGLNNIEKAVLFKTKQSLFKMILASNYAGKAINVTKTTAPHAFSYYLTTKFNIPHGHAVGILLPVFYQICLDSEDSEIIDKRGVRYFRDKMSKLNKLISNKSETHAIFRLNNLLAHIGLNKELKEIADNFDYNEFFECVNIQRLKNFPVKIKKDLLKRILI